MKLVGETIGKRMSCAFDTLLSNVEGYEPLHGGFTFEED